MYSTRRLAGYVALVVGFFGLLAIIFMPMFPSTHEPIIPAARPREVQEVVPEVRWDIEELLKLASEGKENEAQRLILKKLREARPKATEPTRREGWSRIFTPYNIAAFVTGVSGILVTVLLGYKNTQGRKPRNQTLTV